MTDRDQIRREIATPINQSTSSEENRARALGALDALLAELEQAERERDEAKQRGDWYQQEYARVCAERVQAEKTQK